MTNETTGNMPILVIEPVKTEYRMLKTQKSHPKPLIRNLAQNLEIYTPGNEAVSPLRLNPFDKLPGIHRNENIEDLQNCFLAAMPVTGPLPPLIGEALEHVSEIYPDPNNPPTMKELFFSAEQELAKKRYSAETNSDIRAALEVRLGALTRRSIGKVFHCRKSVPSIQHLMSVPVIIELDHLPHYPSCILTLFLLTAIRQYAKTTPYSGKGPRLVIIIEEAHLIVGRNTDATPSPDFADPRAFTSQFICRMLLELRALGVVVVIVDQNPSGVAAEVIKNTASKLAFRQVDSDDREDLGGTMLFGPTQMEEIARLETGEAFFYTEGYHGPRRIRTVNTHDEISFGKPLINEQILPYIREDAWFKKAARARVAEELIQLRQKMDHFDQERLHLVQKAARLHGRYLHILAHAEDKSKRAHPQRLMREAYSLKEQLEGALEAFIRGAYRPLLDNNAELYWGELPLKKIRENLVHRFESIIKPDIEAFLNMINSFITRCAKTLNSGG